MTIVGKSCCTLTFWGGVYNRYMGLPRPFRIGVVGLGHQSLEDHIPAIRMSKDVVLVGVVEIDKEKLKSFTELHPDIPGYDDLDLFLREQKPEILIIAVPHHVHYEITKKVLSKGIHVLKEKPFAVSLAQAKELAELAKKHNAKMSITLQRRFNPVYSTFLQLKDKIGDPFYISSKYTFYTDSPHTGWRGKRELAGGGCVIDMGYHMIDLLVWYFGLPDKVFAEFSCGAKENECYDAEDTAQIIFKYDNSKLWGSLLISRVVPPKQEYFNVYATRGDIHLERGKIERFAPNGKPLESLSRQNSWPSACQDQIEHFIRVITDDKENLGSPEFHFNHLAFIEAAYKSKEIGAYVSPKEILLEEEIGPVQSAGETVTRS